MLLMTDKSFLLKFYGQVSEANKLIEDSMKSEQYLRKFTDKGMSFHYIMLHICGKKPESHLSAVLSLAFTSNSTTRFLDRESFSSASSAFEMIMSSCGITTDMPSIFSTSLNSLAVKAACHIKAFLVQTIQDSEAT